MGKQVPHELALQLGELLRDYRRAAGLTQEELAERAGVSPRSISELERGGRHIPRRDTVALLSRALGLDDTARVAFEALIEQRRRTREVVAAAVPQPHTVPRALNSLVGREADVQALTPLLSTAPLLTLVGSGGVGKTRLAQELIRQTTEFFPDGCGLVELAGLSDPSLVAAAVATAVGLEDLRSRRAVDSLLDYLRDKHMLLVLDNCEHVIDACADVIGQLLARCPDLHVLATSREPVNIAGETVRRVLPLDLPASQRLFVDRARSIDQTFVPTPEDNQAISRICVGLDGIPLALELAAARTRMLSVEQLAERLEHDSSLLVATDRASLPQHRTMRATLDWSHDLLTADEQAVLRRLSVFLGGWSIAMAEQVCSAHDIQPAAVLDLLSQLVDRSMVQVEIGRGVARYRLLEPIRQYAAERLEASGEATEYRDRHCLAMFGVVFAHQAGAAGPDEIASLDRLEPEHSNLRTALRWALTHDRGAEALRCVAALFRFWERRGHFQEGCFWLEQALEATPDEASPERGWALNALAFLCWRGGDVDRAEPVAKRALTVCRQAGLPRDIAQALLNLGMIAYQREQSDVALSLLEEGVAIAREGGMLPQLSLALSFYGRARLWMYGASDTQAFALLHEGLDLARASRSLYVTGHALMRLGELYWARNETDRALALWRESLVVRAELTDRRGMAGAIERVAHALAAQGQFEDAAWFFGAASAQHRAVGIKIRNERALDHSRLFELTRASLGSAFETAWSAGHAARSDEMVIRALDETATQSASFAW